MYSIRHKEISLDIEGVHDQMYVFERDIIIARSTTLVYYRSMWTGLYKPKVKLPSYMISSIVTMKQFHEKPPISLLYDPCEHSKTYI